MKTHLTAKLSLGVLLLAAGLARGQAQSGTWTSDANGLWSNPANWLNGAIANGTDATADFSTLDITADRTVTLDGSRTLGSLFFGDVAGAQNWFLNSNGGSTLTLAVSAGAPTIAVSNNTATLNLSVGGTAGLTKTGNGTLVLASPASYSGGTTLSGGTLQLTNAPAGSSTGPLLAFSFDHVSGNTVINDGTGGTLMNGTLVGNGAAIVPGGVHGGNALSIGNLAVNAGYVLVNNQVTPFHGNTTGTAWTVSMWLKTTNAGAAYLYQGDGGWANQNTSFFLTVSNSSGGKVGGVRYAGGWMNGNADVNDGNWHFIAITDDSGAKTIFVDGLVDTNYYGTNNWSIPATGSQVWIGGSGDTGDGNRPFNGLIDEVSIYNRALSQSEVAALMTSTISPATAVSVLPAGTTVSVASATKLDLNGNNQALAGLSGAGLVDTTLSNTALVLTLNNNADLNFSGSLSNSAGTLFLIKSGTGALTLSGPSGYTGHTWLNDGTLNLNHASALGSGTSGRLLINGGTIDNTSSGAITLAANKPQTWVGDFTFTGSANLNLGSGIASLSGSGSTRQVTVNAGTLTVGSLNSRVLGMGLTKAGAGTLALGSAASTIGGTLNVAAGKLQIGANDFTAAGLTGSGIIENGSGTTRWLYLNTTNNQTFSGVLQNGSGSGRLGFNKNGTGTLTLSGLNTYNDTTTIQMGSLRVLGTNTIVSSGNGLYNVGTLAYQNGVLDIAGGTVNASKNNNPSMQLASAQNARGFIKLSAGGTLTTGSELHIGQGSGNATNPPYAAMSMESGTMTNGSYLVVGFNNDRAIFNQRGGSVTVAANVMTIAAGGTGSYGVVNLSGGTFTSMAGSGGIYVGERGLGVLNVSGSASLSLANYGLTVGPSASQSGWTGIANLLGGTLACNRAVKGNGTGTAYLNFNGGTLLANAANASFINGLDRVTVYSGGATIDDGGFAVTALSQLTAPSGNGVLSIPLISGGSNYLDAPLVMITNVDGVGASAIAQIDYNSGAVTNILVTSPGNDFYTVPTVGLFGGGGSGAVLGTPVLGPCASGGLTKNGSGTLTLAGGYTCTGPTVVNAGTLAVNPSSMYVTVGAVTVNGNAVLAVDASSGAAFPCASLTLQNNSALTLNYGTVYANPSWPAINVIGSLSAPGASNVINIVGFGLQVGTIPLIHYGTASLNLNNFSLGPLPPGVRASLVNNTANSSIDLQITSAGQNLVWSGYVTDLGQYSSNWDISITPDWVQFGVLTPAQYQEYTTTTTMGDPVRFDDTLHNDYVNPPSTNIWLTTNVVPFTVTVDSTMPYSFAGPGSLGGQGILVKTNLGSLTIGTLNSYTGGTFIYGGSLVVSNDAGLGAPAGAVTLGGGTLDFEGTATNTRVFTLLADSSIAAGPGTTLQLGGPINGRARLNFDGLGTKILTNTGSAMLHVRGGALILQGNTRFTNTVNWCSIAPYYDSTVPTANAQMILRNNAWLEVGNYDFNVSDSTLAGGGDSGRLDIQDNAVLRASRVWIGKGLNATGVVYQTGGIWTNALGGTDIRLGGNGTDQTATFGGYYLSGGRADIQQNFQIGAYGYGEMVVSGGSFNAWAGYPSIGRYSNSVGVLTVSAGQFNQFNTGTYMLVGENGTGTLNVSGSGVVNVTNTMRVGGGAGVGNGTINLLTGGRLIAPGFTTPSGGMATFNFNGGTLQANASSSAFLQGLTAANLLAGGAVIDSSSYNITIGQALLGSGGLTKNGTGALTLLGADSYSGPTLVNAGRLLVTPAHQGAGPVTVADGAGLGVFVNAAGTATLGTLTIGTAGTNYLDVVLNTGSNPTSPVLQAGTVTLNGTCALRLNGLLAVGTFPVLKYSSLVGSFLPAVSGPQGMVATVVNDTASSTVYVNISQLGSGLVWTGTNSLVGRTNLWDLNSTTNWLAGTTPTYYQEFFPPGDSVTFNDAGSGSVLLSNTVSPAAVSFNNSLVNYSLTGSGHVSGFAGLTKNGSGTVTLGWAGNDYTGDTVVNSGTLQLGSATAIPNGGSAGKLVVNSGGTVDLNGLSSTFKVFSGSGRIDNSSGNVSTLTVGNLNTSSTWDGTMDSSGSGGLLLTKVGTGTLTLTGTNYFRNGGANQINGGTLLLTNNGAVFSSGEFWFQEGAGSATGIVAGATLICSNWLVVARDNSAANATLIVNSGTVQKAGGNNIVVGSLGAQGTLIVNGGRVLNNGMLWLGENSTANGTLYLNGGLIQATQVRPNNTVASSTAYFNGGILQASAASTNFLVSSGIIQSNGLVLDDGGFSISIATGLQGDGSYPAGGLTKQGAGTVYLDGVNSYSGTTLVSTGMLAGLGTLSAPVLVAPTGNLGAGEAGTNMGTLTINSDLTLQGQATFRVAKTGGVRTNDQIAVLGRVTYGGTLVVTNLTSDGTPLAVGDTFTLFPGMQSGSFASVVGLPGPGLAYSFANGVLSVVVGNPAPVITSVTPSVGRTNGGTLVTITGSGFQSGLTVQFGTALASSVNYSNSTLITALTPPGAPGAVNVMVQNPDSQTVTLPAAFTYVLPPPPPTLSSAVKSGGNLVLTWLGGTNANCLLFSATNVTLPRASWSVVATNVVLADGRSTNTIPINPGEPKRFYLLSVPYN